MVSLILTSNAMMRPVILSRPANTATGFWIFTAGISTTTSSPGWIAVVDGGGGFICPAPGAPGSPTGGTDGPVPGALATLPGGGASGAERMLPGEPGGPGIGWPGSGAPRPAVCGMARAGGCGGAASSSISSGGIASCMLSGGGPGATAGGGGAAPRLGTAPGGRGGLLPSWAAAGTASKASPAAVSGPKRKEEPISEPPQSQPRFLGPDCGDSLPGRSRTADYWSGFQAL